ncbi:MAG: hypothetical protein M1831_000139 [Alyxoria varia]|nr:MAG: hypothetical protein M1831_000139 [Alyxoria varia]
MVQKGLGLGLLLILQPLPSTSQASPSSNFTLRRRVVDQSLRDPLVLSSRRESHPNGAAGSSGQSSSGQSSSGQNASPPAVSTSGPDDPTFEFNGKEYTFVIANCEYGACHSIANDDAEVRALCRADSSGSETSKKMRRSHLVKRGNAVSTVDACREFGPEEQPPPWAILQKPWSDILTTYLRQSKRYKPMYMAAPNSNRGIISPELFIWLRQNPVFARLPRVYGPAQIIFAKLEYNLHFYVSPRALYELCLQPVFVGLIGREPYPPQLLPLREIGGDEQWFQGLFHEYFPWPRSFRAMVRLKLSQPDNVFDADPRLAELREELLIEGLKRWCKMGNALAEGRRLNIPDDDDYFIPDQGYIMAYSQVRQEAEGMISSHLDDNIRTMSREYAWGTMTKDEAIGLEKLLEYIQRHLYDRIWALSSFSLERGNNLDDTRMESRSLFAASIWTLRKGHQFGRKALQLAIENPETNWEPSGDVPHHERIPFSKERPAKPRWFRWGWPPRASKKTS